MKAGIPYKFNIINMEKPTSVFNEGMKILCYMDSKANKGIGWHR
jgi:hypothetical protein